MRTLHANICSRAARALMAATIVFVSTAVAAPANAAPAQPLCFAGDRAGSDQAQNEELNLAVAHLRQSGASQDKIDRFLNKSYGLELVSRGSPASGGAGTMSSSPNNLNVPPPEIWRDTCTGRYSVFAYWNWTSISAIASDVDFWCNVPCALGGYDGFGVALNRSVASVGGYSMTTWGRTSYYPASLSRMSVDAANATGVSYVGQDIYCADVWPCEAAPAQDFNFYNGQLVYSINSPGCGSLQAFSLYAHTWNGTAVNGISVGPWSLGVSWSSSSNRWPDGSQPSNTVYPC
jgi:hypothetical protein